MCDSHSIQRLNSLIKLQRQLESFSKTGDLGPIEIAAESGDKAARNKAQASDRQQQHQHRCTQQESRTYVSLVINIQLIMVGDGCDIECCIES